MGEEEAIARVLGFRSYQRILVRSGVWEGEHAQRGVRGDAFRASFTNS